MRLVCPSFLRPLNSQLGSTTFQVIISSFSHHMLRQSLSVECRYLSIAVSS